MSTPAGEPSNALSPRGGLRRLAMRGAAFELVAYAVISAVRFVNSVILTRLLVTDDVGTALLVAALPTGLVMVTDAGFLQATLQSKRGDEPAFLDTVWTLQVLRGVAIAALCVILAWPYAAFFSVPVPLLFVSAAQLAISGLHSTAIYQLRRRVELQWVVSYEVGGQLLGVAITLTWAAIAPSPWALIGGGAAKVLVDSIVSHFLPGRLRHRFHLDREAVREIRAVARWIMASSAVSFVGGYTDRLTIGKLLGDSTLAVYSIALNLADLVGGVVVRLISGVAYPVLSSQYRHGDRDRLRAVFYALRWRLDVVFMPSLGALVVLGPWIVSVVWQEPWHGAGWMLQILCARTALDLTSHAFGTLLTSIGEQRLVFTRNVVRTVAILVLVPSGYALAGQVGLLWSLSGAELLAMMVLARRLRQLGLLWPARELVGPLAGAGGAVIAWAFRSLVLD
jgi:O-antigen/teichoic acid export membrane protein